MTCRRHGLEHNIRFHRPYSTCTRYQHAKTEHSSMGAYHPENDGHIRRRDTTVTLTCSHHHHRCPSLPLVPSRSTRYENRNSINNGYRTTAFLDDLDDMHGCAKEAGEQVLRQMVNKTRCVPAPVPHIPFLAQVSARETCQQLHASARVQHNRREGVQEQEGKCTTWKSKSCGTYLNSALVLRVSVD